MPSSEFLAALFGRCADLDASLTLTAIHPDGRHRTPSRHVPLNDTAQLDDALTRLQAANRLGWGAYFAVALRRPGLGRWRRGGLADLAALPALFADVDDPQALARIQAHDPPPSAIVHSGGGFHAYWWLESPTANFAHAGRILRTLSQRLGGDRLSAAQSLRLPGSRNTKPHRGGLCQVVSLTDRRYPLAAFPVSEPTRPQARIAQLSPHSGRLNPALIDAVSAALIRTHGGYVQRNGWIAALCPCGHAHDRPGAHFGFSPAHGVGVCFGRHGRILLKDLCTCLGVLPADYGGLYLKENVT